MAATDCEYELEPCEEKNQAQTTEGQQPVNIYERMANENKPKKQDLYLKLTRVQDDLNHNLEKLGIIQ